MTVLDASALLGFLQGEAGADVVEAVLQDDGVCAAVNWSETAQKVRARGADWPLARSLLIGYGVRVEPVGQPDAERAADLWNVGSGLSLGDRLCLAVAERLGSKALTADRAWPNDDRVVQIR